ncbi:protein of unknown function [Cyanobium sp. NIES-981]|nr:protein of unknown function [Cyanobium sp. NIES-981]
MGGGQSLRRGADRCHDRGLRAHRTAQAHCRERRCQWRRRGGEREEQALQRGLQRRHRRVCGHAGRRHRGSRQGDPLRPAERRLDRRHGADHRVHRGRSAREEGSCSRRWRWHGRRLRLLISPDLLDQAPRMGRFFDGGSAVMADRPPSPWSFPRTAGFWKGGWRQGWPWGVGRSLDRKRGRKCGLQGRGGDRRGKGRLVGFLLFALFLQLFAERLYLLLIL